MGNKPIRIVFTLLDNYVAQLAVVLESIFYSNANCCVNVGVITNGLKEENCKYLKYIVERNGGSFEEKIVDEKYFEDLAFSFHFAPVNYFRLHISKFFIEDVILYLDVDLLVLLDISELIRIDFKNYILAAVPEENFNRHEDLGMNVSSKYFNAGVLLINNEKWKELNFGNLTLDFIRNNKDKIIMADQDGMNAVLNGSFLPLNFKYNLQANQFNLHSWNKTQDKGILHFSGSIKPWHLFNRAPKHPLWYLYWVFRFKVILKYSFLFFIKKIYSSK
jgi:lipopolysaccharide biosynthesis glycosyltransferase